MSYWKCFGFVLFVSFFFSMLSFLFWEAKATVYCEHDFKERLRIARSSDNGLWFLTYIVHCIICGLMLYLLIN
jgi:hypothetical protein